MFAKSGLPTILGRDIPIHDFPETLSSNAIEQRIQSELPAIASLMDQELSALQRVAVLQATTDAEYVLFSAKHGNPFGEVLSETSAAPQKAFEYLATEQHNLIRFA